MLNGSIQTIEEENSVVAAIDSVILKHNEDGKLIKAADFFDDLSNKLTNEFDIVVYRISAMPRYYLGLAVSRAYQVLQINGILAVDINGFAGDMDEVVMIVEYLGFKLYDKVDGLVYFFKKIEESGSGSTQDIIA